MFCLVDFSKSNRLSDLTLSYRSGTFEAGPVWYFKMGRNITVKSRVASNVPIKVSSCKAWVKMVALEVGVSVAFPIKTPSPLGAKANTGEPIKPKTKTMASRNQFFIGKFSFRAMFVPIRNLVKTWAKKNPAPKGFWG